MRCGRWVFRTWIVAVLVAVAVSARGQQVGEVGTQDASPSSDASQTTFAELSEYAYEVHSDDLRPSSFQGVTPGKTLFVDLESLLGKPKGQQRAGDTIVWNYEVGPFDQVEIEVHEGRVEVIRVTLPTPEAVVRVEQQLGLAAFCPAPIYDDQGRWVGMAFPERGIDLIGSTNDGALMVERLVLRRITSGPFVDRALSDREHRYSRQLADLECAVKVNPSDGRALRWHARTLLHAGRIDEALKVAQRCVAIAGEVPANQLVLGEALGAAGRCSEAIKQLDAVAQGDDVPADVKGAAHAALGDLLADSSSSSLKEALQHHQAAIQSITPLATAQHPIARRQARELLIRCYLAVARDLAQGQWRNGEQAIEKWLASANRLAGVVDGTSGKRARFRVLCNTVAVAAVRPNAAGQEVPLEEALTLGKQLVEASQDPVDRLVLDYQLAWLATQGARVTAARGDYDRTSELAEEAIALCEAHREEDASKRWDSLLGYLYFYRGSTYAIGRTEHDEAVKWYKRAIPLLESTASNEEPAVQGRIGELFVSMGVSYWESASKEEAVDLTRKGLNWMQQAARSGFLAREDLAVPYGNLASMHRQLGQDDEARRMAVIASKLEETDDTEQR